MTRTTAAEREQRAAKASFEALLTGWNGALLSSNNFEARRRARDATAAARRAVAAGMTPYAALLGHVAPVFKTGVEG